MTNLNLPAPLRRGYADASLPLIEQETLNDMGGAIKSVIGMLVTDVQVTTDGNIRIIGQAADGSAVDVILAVPGSAIQSVDVDATDHLIITYLDGSTYDAGLLPVSTASGLNAAQLLDLVKTRVALVEQINRQGAALEIVSHDHTGTERRIRFVGAERQSLAGTRRLAYIPTGVTPTDVLMRETGKSAVSQTEFLLIENVITANVAGHNMVLWHVDSIRQIDTIITSFGAARLSKVGFSDPIPLQVNGEHGYYYIRDAAVVTGINIFYIYIESQRLDVVSPIYAMFNYTRDFPESVFLNPLQSKVHYDPQNIFIPDYDAFPYVAVAPNLVDFTDDLFTTPSDSVARHDGGLGGITVTWVGSSSYPGRRISVMENVPHPSDAVIVVVLWPDYASPLTGLSIASGRFPSQVRASASLRDVTLDRTLNGVNFQAYKFESNTALSSETRYMHFQTDDATLLSPTGAVYLGLAVPASGPDIDKVRSRQTFQDLLAYYERIPGVVSVDGRDFKVWSDTLPSNDWFFTHPIRISFVQEVV